MLHQAARTILTLILTGSLCLTLWTGYSISQNPALRPLVDRTAAGIIAETDRLLLAEATPEAVAARLEALLAEPEHNWLAIEALLDLAIERGLKIPASLGARLQTAHDADTGFFATARKCALCAFDPSACELSAVLICQAPMVLTPLGDLAGVVLEAGNYLTGAEVDQINLTLSLVGLAAVGLVVVSGGSSAMVKLGASTAKLARRMNLLSPRLSALLVNSATNGVDWALVPAARSTDDLAAALRPQVLQPVVQVLTETGRLNASLGAVQTLHVLRYIDSADDARKLGNAAEALGPRMVGRLELLGKSRFLRATLRVSDTVWQLLAGFLGLLSSLTGMLGSMMSSVGMRGLRRIARTA